MVSACSVFGGRLHQLACVHVLDPDGIHRPIKHHPFAVQCRVCHCCPDNGGSQPISPLIGQQVVLPIQLSHLDALGVEGVGVGDLQFRDHLQHCSEVCQQAVRPTTADVQVGMQPYDLGSCLGLPTAGSQVV